MSEILTSKEMFINMKNPPIYNPSKSYFDQSKDVIQFYAEEKEKIENGVNIGGFFIHPWMYYHLNYFKTPIPQPNGTEKMMSPPLDDNFLYVVESYQEAERLNKGLCLFGTRGFAKALRDCEPILYTDKVWRPIGDAKVGDKIFGADGRPTTILNVSPQGVVDNYRMTLRDGRDIICSDDHLWEVYDSQARGYKTLPLKEILKKYKYSRKYSGSKYADGEDRVNEIYNYYIPTNLCMEFSKEDLPVDPYWFGLYLGDGDSAGPCITTDDQEIVEYSKKIAELYGLHITKRGEMSYRITHGINGKENPLTKQLRDLEVINNKHIPEIYMNGSEEQRMELLRGLMDSDGHISKSSQIKFSQANYDFIKQVSELCHSLGINNTIQERGGSYLKKDGELNKSWDVVMYTSKDVFKLPRKLDRIQKVITKGKEFRQKHSAIVDISKVESSRATCIRVDNSDKLFVTRDYIVTHNSTDLSSVTAWLNTIKSNGVTSIIGGSEPDLLAISGLLEKNFNNVNPAFYLPRLKTDWESFVEFGIKEKTGHRFVHSQISITNANKGTAKQSEKGAGLSPIGYIMDEIGKYDCKGILQSALPSFRTQYGSKLVHILSGTGGNKVLSQDAKDILSNPEAYDLVMMNWDRLDRSVPEEAITWERSKKTKFSMFVPGQMSYRLSVPKIEKNLSEIVGIKNKDLDNVKIKVTDWIEATNVIQHMNKSLQREEERQRNQMYYPLEIADCFLTESNNPFPVTTIDRHIRKLEDEGRLGKDIGLFREGGRFKYELINKQRAAVKHNGGVADAPIILFSEFPDKETPPRGLYVSGLDGYKIDVSESDSLGSFYILKRRNQEPNEPCEKIVASYTARPERMRDFNATCEKLSDTWNAECLMESIDLSFKQFLESKGREYDILAPAISFSGLTSKKAPRLNSKFGLYPNIGNNQYRFNVLVDYCKEEHTMGIDDDGNPIIKLGVEFIEDLDLLREMLNWSKTGNFDRITAFSHALVFARELDKRNIHPDKVQSNENITEKEFKKRQMLTSRNRYGMTRGSRYGTNKGKKY